MKNRYVRTSVFVLTVFFLCLDKRTTKRTLRYFLSIDEAIKIKIVLCSAVGEN